MFYSIDAFYFFCKWGDERFYYFIHYYDQFQYHYNQDNAIYRKPFGLLCQNGHLKKAQWLLERKPSIFILFGKYNPLQLACETGHLHIVQWLLNIKPSEYYYAMQLACKNGQYHITKWLLDIDQSVIISSEYDNPFQLACKHGHMHIAHLILKINPSIISALNQIADTIFESCENGHIEIVQWLFTMIPKTMNERNLYQHAFIGSCRGGHFHIMQWLLTMNPSCYEEKYNNLELNDSESDSPFEIACQWGHLHIAQWSLQMESPQKYQDAFDRSCRRAFQYACEDGHLHIAQWILEINPSTTASFNYRDLFYTAVCHLDILQWLEEIRFDGLEFKDSSNYSFYPKLLTGYYDVTYSFQYLCQGGKLQFAQWLFSNKPDIINKFWNDPQFQKVYQIVCQNGHEHIAKWLIESMDRTQRNKVIHIYNKYFNQFHCSFSKSIQLLFPYLIRKSKLSNIAINDIGSYFM